jgi:hypothetical protein
MLCHFTTCLLNGCADICPKLMLQRMCSVSVFKTEDKTGGRKLCGSNGGYVFCQTNGSECWERRLRVTMILVFVGCLTRNKGVRKSKTGEDTSDVFMVKKKLFSYPNWMILPFPCQKVLIS